MYRAVNHLCHLAVVKETRDFDDGATAMSADHNLGAINGVGAAAGHITREARCAR